MSKEKYIKDLKVGDTVYLYSIDFTMIHHVLANDNRNIAGYCGVYKVRSTDEKYIYINSRSNIHFSNTSITHITIQNIESRYPYGNIYFISTEPIYNIEEEFKIMLNNFFIETAEILFSHCYKELQNKEEKLSIEKITTVPVKVVETEYKVSQYNNIYSHYE